MPNHTTVLLKMHGPEDAIRNFVILANGSWPEAGEPGNLEFQNLYPMPQELEGTTAPPAVVTQAEIDARRARDDATHAPASSLDNNSHIHSYGITQETYDRLISTYGYADWYSWRVANWGTKWGAYEVGEWHIDINGSGYLNAMVGFQTAWAPPDAFLLNVSKNYPGVQFHMSHSDEGGSFLGWMEIVEGVVINQLELDWHSLEGMQLRKELGVLDLEDMNKYDVEGRIHYLKEHPDDTSDELELEELETLLKGMSND